MPTCQQTMSVTRERALHHRADRRRPRSTSSHHRGSAPRRPLGRVLRRRSRRSRRRCRARARSSSYFLRSRAFVALGADHEPVLAGQQRCRRRRGTPAPVHSCTARSANSLGLSSTPTSALRRRTRVPGPQRRPPLAGAGRVEGVHAAERVALHQVALRRRVDAR